MGGVPQPQRSAHGRSLGAAHIAPTALVVALVGIAVLAVGGPLLLGALLSQPPSPGGQLRSSVGERVRDIAYRLRDERVRAALDRGADLTEVAALTGTTRIARTGLAADDGERLAARGTVLLGAERVGADGSAVTVALVGTFATRSLLTDEATPWVACLRVELPVTAADATGWALQDATCPGFSGSLRRNARRISAGDLTVAPLLRPPCFGADCPGG